MINYGQLAGFYTDENVEKNLVDFGLKVKRWLQLTLSGVFLPLPDPHRRNH